MLADSVSASVESVGCSGRRKVGSALRELSAQVCTHRTRISTRTMHTTALEYSYLKGRPVGVVCALDESLSQAAAVRAEVRTRSLWLKPL